MPPPNRTISPGVSSLIPKLFQEILWALQEATPLLPCIFELRKGKGKYTNIKHLCLLPYYNEIHKIDMSLPNNLHDLRITILQTESGSGLLMRLSNKKLEASFSENGGPPSQGSLDFD